MSELPRAIATGARRRRGATVTAQLATLVLYRHGYLNTFVPAAKPRPTNDEKYQS